jgi:hypothetical protein
MLAGTEKVRLYHKTLSLPTTLLTPDKDDSAAKGTRILPSKEAGIVSADFGRIE